MGINFADLHCDTAYECCVKKKKLSKNNLHISLEKLKLFDNNIQIFAVWTSYKLKGIGRYNNFIKVYENFISQIKENNEHISLCKTSYDISIALSMRKTAAILSIEDAGALNGDIKNVSKFFDMGVRFMTLTWNGENELGFGMPYDEPLKEFGKDVVKEMNRLGMILDVSHLCEKGFFDVCDISNKTFIASHSNSKEICSHQRNLTNEQFKEIVKRKGLVGINFCPLFLNGGFKADINDILRHIEHFLSLGGEKTVCIGADFDGITEVPDGINGVEGILQIPEEMLKHNIKEKIVKDIMFNNAYNFMKKNT